MKLIHAWNRAVLHDPLRPDAFLDRVRIGGAVYGDVPLCRYRRPQFIRRETARRYLRLVSGLHLAFRAARALMEEDGLDGRPASLACRLGVPPQAIALAAAAPPVRSAATLARLETVCIHGQPRVLELRPEAPAGMGYADALAGVFQQDPLLPQGAEAIYGAEAAARAVVNTWREQQAVLPDRPPRVALVDFLDVPTRHEFLLMQAAFAHIGVECVVADPRALRFEDGRLWLDQAPIDAVYRRLLIDDLLARPADCAALLDAWRARAVCVVNSLRAPLLHTRGLLALLHDGLLRARLPTSLVRLIDAHVPYAALLSGEDGPAPASPPGLRAALLREPERWVLKPLQGPGAVCGAVVDGRAWAAAVEGAGEGWLAQHHVPHPQEDFPDALAGYAPVPLCPTLDAFLIDGRLAGFLSRLRAPDAPEDALPSVTPVFVTDATAVA